MPKRERVDVKYKEGVVARFEVVDNLETTE